MEIAIEPKTQDHAKRLADGLQAANRDFARLRVHTDAESRQSILCGPSEDYLERVLASLDDGIFNVGAPQVAYREGLTKVATLENTYKVLQGPKRAFGKVVIRFEPLPEGMGVRFTRATSAIPDEYISAIDKAVHDQAASGVIAGFPLQDFEATLVDGAYHEVDSCNFAFADATRAAVRNLGDHGAVRLLEPIMAVEVAVPEDYLGGIIGDLNSRRGYVLETLQDRAFYLVQAQVPLANMFGYGGTLRSMAQGKAAFAMKFDHYAPIDPPSGPDDVFPGTMAMRA
jgi:elongation factor G